MSLGIETGVEYRPALPGEDDTDVPKEYCVEVCYGLLSYFDHRMTPLANKVSLWPR